MQLITPEYRQLNQQMHAEKATYGTSGCRHTKAIMTLVMQHNTQNILDYGCGKSTLARNLPFRIQQYDPAVPKYAASPMPADIVVCTDVLEHIEPNCLDALLLDLAQLTEKILFASVCTSEAVKTLPDGRNAHLIVKSAEWWQEKLSTHFTLLQMQRDNEAANDILFILEKKTPITKESIA